MDITTIILAVTIHSAEYILQRFTNYDASTDIKLKIFILMVGLFIFTINDLYSIIDNL